MEAVKAKTIVLKIKSERGKIMKKTKKLSAILLSLFAVFMLSLSVLFGGAEVAKAAEPNGDATEADYVCQLVDKTNPALAHQFTSIGAAITELKTNGDLYENSINLVKDRIESIVIPTGLTVTLNLGGNILTNEEGRHTIEVEKDGNLTVVSESNGTVDNVSHGRGAIVNRGTVVLNGGRYTRSAEKGTYEPYESGGNSWYVLSNQGNMTINENVNVIEANGGYSSLIENGFYDESENTEKTPAILDIKGGMFSGGINTVKNDTYGTITITGGTFTNAVQNVVLNYNELTVIGGEFNADGTAKAAIQTGYVNAEYAKGITAIEGGAFNGAIATVAAAQGAEYSITGGTFSELPKEEYLMGGNLFVKSGEKFVTTPAATAINDGYVVTVNGVAYTSLNEAIATAPDDANVKLLVDVTLTDRITIKNSLTLDLNGHKITHAGDKILVNGEGANVVITSSTGKGTIEQTATAGSMTAIWAVQAQSVTIKNVTIDSGDWGIYLGDTTASDLTVENIEIVNSSYGILVFGTGKVNISDSTIRGRETAVTGNGTYHGTDITLKNCTIIADKTAVFHPQYGTLTIDGGVVTGASGIEMRSGSLIVRGGADIRATGEQYLAEPNGSGSTVLGAAIAISQHTTNKPINVTVEDAILTGDKALVQVDTVANTEREPITLTITGGEFHGEVETGLASSQNIPERTDVTGFIKGGTFINAPNANYYASDTYVYKEGENVIVAVEQPQGVTFVEVDGVNYAVEMVGEVTDIVVSVTNTDGKITGYNNFEEAITNVQSGDTIKLFKNVALTDRLIVNNSLTLDLGNKTLTCSATMASDQGGTVTNNRGMHIDLGNPDGVVAIKNGTIVLDKENIYGVVVNNVTLNMERVVVEGTQFEEGCYGIRVGNGNNTTANLNDVIVNLETSGENSVYCAVALITAHSDDSVKATLNATSCNFKGGYAVAGNGADTNTEITLTDCILNAKYAGIFHPQGGTLTVSGGSITGGDSGIEMRAGTLNISGATVTATAQEFDSNRNDSGTTTVGAAIALVQHTTMRDVSVTVGEGTVLTGARAFSQEDLQGNGEAGYNKITVSLEGGEFHGEVVSDNKTDFIKGGTFTNAPNANYYADGSYVYKEGANVIVASAQPQDITFMEVDGVNYALDIVGEVTEIVASVTDEGGKITGYSSLNVAIAEAPDGANVKLLADVTLSGTIIIDKSLTLDLNGYDITHDGDRLQTNNGEANVVITSTARATSQEETSKIACTGNNGNNIAVWVKAANSFELTNVNIESNNYGVYIQRTTGNINIENVNVTATYVGMFITDSVSAETTITSCTFGNSDFGITDYSTGKTTCLDTQFTDNYYGVCSENAAEKVYTNCFFSSSLEDNYGIYAVGIQGSEASIVVERCQIKSAASDSCGIAGNGTEPGTNIIVRDTAITAARGIYHPQEGTLVIDGGSITGSECGIEMRAGTLIVRGGSEITTTTEYSAKPNNSGSTVTGAAIAVSQHSTNKPITVTIEDAILTGEKALVQVDTIANTEREPVTLSITGGTFNGAVETGLVSSNEVTSRTDVIGFIEGGTFTNLPDYTYFAPEFSAELIGNVYVTVNKPWVAAIGQTGFATLAEAVSSVDNGGEKYIDIKLLVGTNENIVINEGQMISIILTDGATLTNANSNHTVINYGYLSIRGNGTIDNISHGCAAVANYNSIELNEQTTYTRSAENGTSPTDSGGNSYYVILNQGHMNVNSKDVKVMSSSKYSSLIENGWYDGSQKPDDIEGARLTINSGTFGGGINTIKNDDWGKTIINGGTFDNEAQFVILNYHELEILGGTFNAKDSAKAAVATGRANSVYAKGSTAINYGTFNGGLALMNGYSEGVVYAIYGGTYNVNNLSELNLNKLTTGDESIAYVPVESMTEGMVVKFDYIRNVFNNISDLNTIRLVAGRSKESFEVRGLLPYENYVEVNIDGEFVIIGPEKYADIAKEQLIAHRDELLGRYEYSDGGKADLDKILADGLNAIEAYGQNNELSKIDSALGSYKKAMDEVLTKMTYMSKLAQAKLDAIDYVRLYAAAMDVAYSIEFEAIINDENNVTFESVATAKRTVLDEIDRIYIAAESENEALASAKKAAISEIRAAAGTGEDLVVVPTATYAAINAAVDIAQVEEFKNNALEEIKDIRTFRAQIGALAVNGTGVLEAIEAFKAELLGDGTNIGKLAETEAALKAYLDTIRDNINERTSTELGATATALNEAINNAVTELKAEIASLSTALSAKIDGIQTAVGGMEEAFGIRLDEATNLISTELAAIKADIANLDADLLTDYNDIISKLNAALAAIDTANGKLDEVKAMVEGIVSGILESDTFRSFATKADVAAVNSAMTALNEALLGSENGAIARLQSALETAISGVKTTVDGIAASLATMGTDITAIKAAVEAIKPTDLTEVNNKIDGLKTALETAIADAVTTLDGKLVTLTENVGTLTGRLEEVNSGLLAEIAKLDEQIANLGSISTDDLNNELGKIATELEGITTAINAIAEQVRVGVDVEQEKTKAKESIDRVLGNLLGEHGEAAGVTLMSAEPQPDPLDGGLKVAQRDKLIEIYGDKLAALIEQYYNDAIQDVENATTISEAQAAANNFKRNVDTAKMIDSIDSGVGGGVYVMLVFAILFSAAAFALALVLLLKKRKTSSNE